MRTTRHGLVALLVFFLPACTVTWREPTIEPLNTNRFYDSTLTDTCDAVEAMITDFGLAIQSSEREERACLLDTDFKVFSDTGDDDINHLKRVAWTGVGSFIGGRYTVTVTTRNVRDGGTRVRVSTRIEGYIDEEFGYQVLRSRGIIEESMFATIGQSLGASPVEGR